MIVTEKHIGVFSLLIALIGALLCLMILFGMGMSDAPVNDPLMTIVFYALPLPAVALALATLILVSGYRRGNVWPGFWISLPILILAVGTVILAFAGWMSYWH